MADPSLLVALFALPFAVSAGWLVARADRIGRPRAAAALVTIGAVLLLLEDPLLTAWFALAPSSVDPDGVAGLVPRHTQAHMLGAAAWALLAFALVIWLAHARIKREADRRAWRVLLAVLVVGASVDVVAYLALYPHGFPVPGTQGFGWPPVAVGITSWAAGLVVTRRALR